MNKKIKIIELLNKIANGEEVPKKIIFLNETLEYDIDCQDYKGFSKTGSGAFFSYLFTNEPTQNFINDRVGILEDNTEEIEEIEIDENNYIHTQEGAWKGRKMDLAFAKIINKLIENVKEMKGDDNIE